MLMATSMASNEKNALLDSESKQMFGSLSFKLPESHKFWTEKQPQWKMCARKLVVYQVFSCRVHTNPGYKAEVLDTRLGHCVPVIPTLSPVHAWRWYFHPGTKLILNAVVRGPGASLGRRLGVNRYGESSNPFQLEWTRNLEEWVLKLHEIQINRQLTSVLFIPVCLLCCWV